MGIGSGIANESAKRQQLSQQQDLMNQAIKGNKDLMDYQQKKQYEMWLNTNYEAQVKHIEAAGLNPALMYKGAGGGITGSTSSSNLSQGNASDQASIIAAKSQQQGMALQNAKLMAEIKNIEADTAYKNANATKTSTIDTELGKTQIENIKQLTENSKVAKEGIELDNQLKEIENMVAAYRDWETDRKSTRLNSSHSAKSRMPSSA